MRRRRRSLPVLLALAVLGVTGAPASAAPVPGPCSGSGIETIALRTFHLEGKPLAPAYRIGEAARVKVRVTRPAHEDPADLGQRFDPPASEPAAGVRVGVGVQVGDAFLFGGAETNDKGLATVRIRLPGYVRPGAADADLYAWRTVVDSPCLRLEENGYSFEPELFTVLPAASG